MTAGSVDRARTVIDAGEGIRLRVWRGDDLDALVMHANDEQVSHGLSDRFPFPYTHADGEAFLSGGVVDFRHPLFAIEIDGEACGGIGVRLGEGERSCSGELGYWLGRAWWGQGRMTRAVRVFAPWAMRELDLYRLQATVLDFNIGSARVLAKSGFAEEGLQRNAVLKRGRLHDLRVFVQLRSLADNGA